MRYPFLLILFFLSSLLFAAEEKSTFRFAQLTDLHCSASMPGNRFLLETNIQRINALHPDFVLVTGDVSEDGDGRTLLEVRNSLEQLACPYYIVMGNHETKWSESGCTAWKDLFGYERFELTHGGVHFLGFNTGPLMRMAYGHVTAQDLRWLRERLESFPPQEPVIIVTHYPFRKGDVDNWYEVTDLLRRYNVRLCIGGHYHALTHLSYDGIPGVLMGASSPDAEGNSHFGLYEVRPDSIFILSGTQQQAPQLQGAYSMQGAVKDFQGNVLDPSGCADAYPDTTDNEHFPVIRQWYRRTDASFYSSPVVWRNRVFVGDDAGVLTAYRLTDGHQLWSFRTGARIVGTPAVQQGVVVVGSADRCIYALDAKKGTLRWKRETEAPVLGAVAIHKGIAYVGGSDHCMRAIALRTGRLIWSYPDVKGYVETLPLVTASHVVFGAWDNTLYSLKQSDGTLEWQWKTPRTAMHYSPAAVWPVEANGKVFIADPERALTAIHAHSGATVWRTFGSMVRESVGISQDGHRLYAKCMNDTVVCYATEGVTPRRLWATAVGFGYEHAPSMLRECEGKVYGSTKEGMIFCLEAQTGRLLWRHRVGNSLLSTVCPLAGGKVLFTSSDGGVGLLSHKLH